MISLLLSMIKRKRIQVKNFNSYKRVWPNLSPLLIPIINYSGYCSERKGRSKFQGVPISNCEGLALLLSSLIKPKRIQAKGFNSFEIMWANLSPLFILIINYSRYLQQEQGVTKISGCPIRISNWEGLWSKFLFEAREMSSWSWVRQVFAFWQRLKV